MKKKKKKFQVEFSWLTEEFAKMLVSNGCNVKAAFSYPG